MTLKRLPLTKVRTKNKVVVVEIQGGQVLENKLMSMGIYPGREIIKLGHFILNGPVPIKVGRTVLALGFGMAGKIIVEHK